MVTITLLGLYYNSFIFIDVLVPSSNFAVRSVTMRSSLDKINTVRQTEKTFSPANRKAQPVYTSFWWCGRGQNVVGGRGLIRRALCRVSGGRDEKWLARKSSCDQADVDVWEEVKRGQTADGRGRPRGYSYLAYYWNSQFDEWALRFL